MENYIYMDVFFLRVFFMNVLCLHSLKLLLRKNSSFKRIVFASLTGAFWNSVVLVSGCYRTGMSLLMAVILCLQVFGMGKEKKEIFLPVFLLLIAFSMEGCINWTGTFHGALLIPFLCWLLGKEKREGCMEMKVVLTFHGKQKELVGFYDSGNRLSEPATGKMVHLVCYDEVKELLSECYRQVIEEYFQTGILNSTKVTELQMYEFTFLSYHSIGKENGQLLGIRMDSAEFVTLAGKKTEDKVVIGLTKQKLFVKGKDRMIVNGRMEV